MELQIQKRVDGQRSPPARSLSLMYVKIVIASADFISNRALSTSPLWRIFPFWLEPQSGSYVPIEVYLIGNHKVNSIKSIKWK